MRKLTTVLSKNQKLHSMNNPEITARFERKINVDNELKREELRRFKQEQQRFIEDNLPQLEAIQDARKVKVYLTSELQTSQFVSAAVGLKLQQKRLIDNDLALVETKASEEHPVLPSRRQLSLLAA